MLQFITNEHCNVLPSSQILQAINGGCRWIQIRLKEASDDEIRSLFFEIRDKAKETLTTVIINDRVELAKSLGADGVAGVHLGRDDMDPLKAREVLGPEAIIGVTAHSFNEILPFKGTDVDYIGVGPFAHTDTKVVQAPVLGFEGMAEIMLLEKENKIGIPCVAVGGITVEDVKPLLELGVNGIAVSGAIANAENIADAVKLFIAQLPIDE